MTIQVKNNGTWTNVSQGYCKVNNEWKKLKEICRNIDGTWYSTSTKVFIYANDGLLYRQDEWDTSNNSNALGIAVVTNNCQFLIDKDFTTELVPWSNGAANNSISTIDGVTTTSDSSVAEKDFNGQSNTSAIVSALSSYDDSTSCAAIYCNEKVFNGSNGYLPSLGELITLVTYSNKINSLLELIGSTSIYDRMEESAGSSEVSGYLMWSSTLSGDLTAPDSIYTYLTGRGLSYGVVTRLNTIDNEHAVPIFPLNELNFKS